jgi:small subunit ribosomal protein S17
MADETKKKQDDVTEAEPALAEDAPAPEEAPAAEAEAPPQPEAVAEPEPDAEAAAETEHEAAAEPEPEPEQEPEASAEPEPEPEAAQEPEAAAETEPEAATEPEPAAEPATEAAAPAAEAKRKKKRLPRALRRQRPKVKRERPAKRSPIVRLPKPESGRGSRQERRGVVVSSAMDKTIVVKVDTIKAHPKYKKVVRRSAKFHAHDEENRANVGDVVRIVETRPLSRTKRWRLAEIVEAAK